LKNPGRQRGARFIQKARRHIGERRDLRLWRNKALRNSARRPQGITPLPPAAVDLPNHHIFLIRRGPGFSTDS
jgi:hypothetical protein